MEKKITHRVLIFDDSSGIRSLLWIFFDAKGYEVFTFPNPASCPISHKKTCPCPLEQSCSDIILSDVNMPIKKGIDFLKEQIQKGCKCKNMALMSGNFANEDIFRAEAMGLKLFKKPFRIEEIGKWVEERKKTIDPSRKLTDWFLESIQHNRK